MRRNAYIDTEFICFVSCVMAVILLIAYTIFGSESRIPEIKRRAPAQIEVNGYTILRYEGYQRGSWGNHGGKAWYHVAERTNPNIRYRMYATLWNGEIQFTYGPPESISNLQVEVSK